MSESGEVNRREVAYRLFAAEFEDADYSYAESDEERAPNYVVTPTGARVNRLFVAGVLTEVEEVNEDVVRARVVDPTGAFVIYAGQYQPEALAALESAETPSFVAVTGKARTFEPDDSDVVYTSIRPESVSEVDAETRDRWNVATAEQTVDRVATVAAALERVERGENLRAVLESAGVEPGLAAGIPLALEHYGTTPAYLAAVRDLALDAARVVAGDAEAAGDLDLAPGEGGDAPLPFAADLDADEAALDETSAAEDGEPADDASADDTAATDDEAVATEDEPVEEAGDGVEDVDDVEEAGDGVSEPETEASSGAAAGATDDADADADAGKAADAEPESAGDGEMYELSEEEREEVKENYDVEFSSGTDIPEGGEEDAGTPEPDADGESEASDGAAESAESAEVAANGSDDDDLGDFDDGDADDEDDDLDDFTEDEYDEPESDSEDEEAGSMGLDLEDYVVDLMEQLDDGDGAPREAVVATAADERDADEGEVEDAIQEALMSGRCYESGDDHLKAI